MDVMQLQKMEVDASNTNQPPHTLLLHVILIYGARVTLTFFPFHELLDFFFHFHYKLVG